MSHAAGQSALSNGGPSASHTRSHTAMTMTISGEAASVLILTQNEIGCHLGSIIWVLFARRKGIRLIVLFSSGRHDSKRILF